MGYLTASISILTTASWLLTAANAQAEAADPLLRPYELDTGLESRSLSFENPTGERGAGGKAAIQQIGWKDGLYERQDDWSCATFWYEPVPSAPLPALPEVSARTADLGQN